MADWPTDTPCRQCGRPIEEERRCYATPICCTCLPPPKPLPVAPVRKDRTNG